MIDRPRGPQLECLKACLGEFRKDYLLQRYAELIFLRLAEAHAKLMFRELVTVQDAFIAIACIQLSKVTVQASLLTTDSMLHSDFPESAQSCFDELRKDLMRRMHITETDLEHMHETPIVGSSISNENEIVESRIDTSIVGSNISNENELEESRVETAVVGSNISNDNNSEGCRVTSLQYHHPPIARSEWEFTGIFSPPTQLYENAGNRKNESLNRHENDENCTVRDSDNIFPYVESIQSAPFKKTSQTVNSSVKLPKNADNGIQKFLSSENNEYALDKALEDW